jgi:hypothetical protein
MEQNGVVVRGWADCSINTRVLRDSGSAEMRNITRSCGTASNCGRSISSTAIPHGSSQQMSGVSFAVRRFEELKWRVR